MKLSKLVAAFLVLAFLGTALGAIAAGKSNDERAPAGQDQGQSRGSDAGRSSRSDDNASRNSSSDREGSDGRGQSDRSNNDKNQREDMRNLTESQREARGAFKDEQRAAREACQGMQGSTRAACERNVTLALRRFNEGQRKAFEDARDGLRSSVASEKLGKFALISGSFSGRFVSFTWDAANRSVVDYAVGGVQVFDRIQIRGAGSASLEVEKNGRVVSIRAGDARLKLHDNPGGVIAGRAPFNGTLVFTIDTAVGALANGSRVELTGPANWSATLSGYNLSLGGNLVTIDREATFVAHDKNPAVPNADRREQGEVEDAKAEHRVGAEITVLGRGGEDVDETELDAGIHVNAQSGNGTVRVVVNGTGIGPRTIVLNVAPGILHANRLAIRFFDEANGNFTEVPIAQASSLQDVLNASDDNGSPEFWMVHDTDGTQVLVSVPHFSTHAFEVQGVLEVLTPNILAGSLAAALLVGFAGVAMFGRKKRA